MQWRLRGTPSFGFGTSCPSGLASCQASEVSGYISGSVMYPPCRLHSCLMGCYTFYTQRAVADTSPSKQNSEEMHGVQGERRYAWVEETADDLSCAVFGLANVVCDSLCSFCVQTVSAMQESRLKAF